MTNKTNRYELVLRDGCIEEFRHIIHNPSTPEIHEKVVIDYDIELEDEEPDTVFLDENNEPFIVYDIDITTIFIQ